MIVTSLEYRVGWMNAIYSLFDKNKIFVDMLMDDNW